MEMPASYHTIIQPDRLAKAVVTRLQQTAAELLASDQHPAYIGVAFGLGTLMSLNPVPFLDMMLALLLLRLVPRLPRAPYLAAMATWNNLVMTPVYASMPGVGRLVVGSANLTPPSGASFDLLFSTMLGAVVIAAGLVIVSSVSVTLLTHVLRRQYLPRVTNAALTTRSD